MLQETELGTTVRKLGLEARHSFRHATLKFDRKVEDQLQRMKVHERVSKVRDGVRKVKDKFGAIYKEKTLKVRTKLGGLMEDAKRSSRGIRGRFDAKVLKWKQKMKEFYQERTMGASQTYSCIGAQMRNFVLSSVLLQHVAFSVLLWRHWYKSEAGALDWSGTSGLVATAGLYWIFALSSMFSRSTPQWIWYSCMSIPLVHMVPYKIVFFDFCLLLLTIGLATVSVFDIYHRLYKDCLIRERSVLQDHLFMSLQATLLFLHLKAPIHATLLTGLVVLFSWRDFISFFSLQRGASFFSQAKQLFLTQIHQWIGIAAANVLWISIVRLTAEIPFSLLHSKLQDYNFSVVSLAILAAEMTLFHCCIVIKYKMRYAKQDAEASRQLELEQERREHEAAEIVRLNIPAPPPLPPHLVRLQQLRLEQEQAAKEARAAEEAAAADVSSLALLHPTVYWHYVWMLGVLCDFLMGLLDRLGFSAISQSLSLVLPVIILVAVLPIQLHYWNNKWNYEIPECTGDAAGHEHHDHHGHHHH